MAKTIRPDGSLDPAADFEDDGGTPEYRARQRQFAATRPNLIQRFLRMPVMHQIGWLAIFPPAFFFSAAASSLLFGYTFNIGPGGGLAIFLALFGFISAVVIRRRRPR